MQADPPRLVTRLCIWTTSLDAEGQSNAYGLTKGCNYLEEYTEPSAIYKAYCEGQVGVGVVSFFARHTFSTDMVGVTLFGTTTETISSGIA